MEEINLKALVENIDVKANKIIETNEFIKSISTDTRQNVKDSLFIALKGENFDGHNFVKEALKNGAKAVLISEDLDISNDAIILKTKNMQKTLMELVSYYRNMLNITIIAVTGSTGKTSTKDMIASVLSEKFNVLKTQENFNNEVGVFKTIFTANYKTEIAVIEMGMQGIGEIKLLSDGVKPDFAVITNIGVAHIEFLKSRENILKAKMEIVSGLKSSLVLNADDEFLQNVKLQNRKIISYGIDNKKADIIGSQIKLGCNGTEFTIENELKAFIPVWGKHNVYNALAAYSFGRLFNLTDKQILNGLKKYKPSGARQKIIHHNNVTYILDYYNANPDSVKMAIKTLGQIGENKTKLFVFADMKELGAVSHEAHAEIGKLAAKEGINFLFCTGEETKITVKTAQIFKANIAQWFKSKSALAEAVKSNLQPNAIIWIKGSRSMKLEDIVKFLNLPEI